MKTFQLAELIYDVTARFCDKYIDPRSRTHDQMVQAARSGRQNIAEGSADSAISECLWVPVIVVNGALSLLNLCIYLLGRQLKAQARAFEQEGGFTERLYRHRTQRRQTNKD